MLKTRKLVKKINVIKFLKICSTQNCVELEKLRRFIQTISVKGYPLGLKQLYVYLLLIQTKL